MSSGKKLDPTETYVLEETAITQISSLEELAELAMRQGEKSAPRSGSGSNDDSKDLPHGSSNTRRR